MAVNNMIGKKNKGFTVIELVVVIAVMAIMMTAAIPSLDRVLNDSQRNTLVMNVETLNAVMENADETSFEGAFGELSKLYADSADVSTSGEIKRLSELIGINGKLNSAVFYDSEEGKWIYLHTEINESVAESVKKDYGQARYYLPVRSAAEILEYRDTGISLALMADIDAANERGLLDENGKRALAGGLALNGHVLSGVNALSLTGEGAALEIISGALVGTEGGRTDVYFGADLKEAGIKSSSDEAQSLGEVRAERVEKLTVTGLISVKSLRADNSGVVIAPGARIVTENGAFVTGGEAFVKTGWITYRGSQAAYLRFSGGELVANNAEGEGLFYCGPIGFRATNGSLVPEAIKLRKATMTPDEDGELFELNNGRFSALDGALGYKVSADGSIALESVRLDESLTLDGNGDAYAVYSLDGRTVIADKRKAVIYSASPIGTLTPYCVAVNDDLTIPSVSLEAFAAGSGAAPEGCALLYTQYDGETLYTKSAVGEYEKTGYYFVWGESRISTSQYHTVTLKLYDNISNKVSVKHGGALLLPKPVRQGYVFGGWYVKDKPEEKLAAGSVYTGVNDALELIAAWTAVTNEMTLSFNGRIRDNFTVSVGGLEFLITDGRSVFLNRVVIEGREYYALYENTSTVDVDGKEINTAEYWCRREAYVVDLGDEKTYSTEIYEIYRRDTGEMVLSAVLPEVRATDSGLTVVMRGQSASVVLPRADAEDDLTFERWETDTRVSYAAGDTLIIESSDSAPVEITLNAKLLENDRSSLMLSVALSDEKSYEVTDRKYGVVGGKLSLISADIKAGLSYYVLSKSGDEWMVQPAIDEAAEISGKTLRINDGETVIEAMVTLSDDKTQLEVSFDKLLFGGREIDVSDGRMSGGEITGSLSTTSGAVTFGYDLTSRMNSAIAYELKSVVRNGVEQTVTDDSIVIESANKGKIYTIDNPERPGASTLRLTAVMLPVDINRFWLNVTPQNKASLDFHSEDEELGDYRVTFSVSDDDTGDGYTLRPEYVTKNGTMSLVNNGIVTINGRDYDINVLIGAQAVSGGETGEGGESGETGETGETGNEGGILPGTHVHTFGFFTTEINGVEVTEYGCVECKEASVNRSIVLYRDVSLTSPFYVPEGAAYTLDLNGHNLITSGDAIYNKGTLTLKSDGFSFPVIKTDENDNLLFTEGEMKGYVIVNNGGAEKEASNSNGVINWGTLYMEAVGVAVSDTYGNAVVNADGGTLVVDNAVILNTGLGNGVYANGGEVTLNDGTVIWSTTYGFAVFVYGDSKVALNGGSYYSTVGFPLCLCGGQTRIGKYCVVDRAKDPSYANYIEMDGLTGEIYWLAGGLDLTQLSEKKFSYARLPEGITGYYPGGNDVESWLFPEDFKIYVSMSVSDEIEYNNWSTQIYKAFEWNSDDPEFVFHAAASSDYESAVRILKTQSTEGSEETDLLVPQVESYGFFD